MMVGHVLGGTEGLAWGCVLAGLILLSCVLSHLRRNKVLKKNTATRIGIVQTAIVLGSIDPCAAYLAACKRRPPCVRCTAQCFGSSRRLGARVQRGVRDLLRLWDPVAKHGLWEPHYPWGGRNNPSNARSCSITSILAPAKIPNRSRNSTPSTSTARCTSALADFAVSNKTKPVSHSPQDFSRPHPRFRSPMAATQLSQALQQPFFLKKTW